MAKQSRFERTLDVLRGVLSYRASSVTGNNANAMLGLIDLNDLRCVCEDQNVRDADIINKLTVQLRTAEQLVRDYA